LQADYLRHPRENGDPIKILNYMPMDFRLRGNDAVFYPPSQKTTGLPVDECEEDTLRSLGEGGLMLRRIDSSRSEVPIRTARLRVGIYIELRFILSKVRNS
jgi:hypothetical protein